MTNDEKLVTEHERGDFLVEIANAISVKRGESYVMLSSVWPPIRMQTLFWQGPDQIIHDDIIINKTICNKQRRDERPQQSKFRNLKFRTSLSASLIYSLLGSEVRGDSNAKSPH